VDGLVQFDERDVVEEVRTGAGSRVVGPSVAGGQDDPADGHHPPAALQDEQARPDTARERFDHLGRATVVPARVHAVRGGQRPGLRDQRAAAIEFGAAATVRAPADDVMKLHRHRVGAERCHRAADDPGVVGRPPDLEGRARVVVALRACRRGGERGGEQCRGSERRADPARLWHLWDAAGARPAGMPEDAPWARRSTGGAGRARGSPHPPAAQACAVPPFAEGRGADPRRTAPILTAPAPARLLACSLLALALLASAAAAQDRPVALVAGNDAYRHAAQLPDPGNDAAGVAPALPRYRRPLVDGRTLDAALARDSCVDGPLRASAELVC
jgi:hypothetical protein